MTMPNTEPIAEETATPEPAGRKKCIGCKRTKALDDFVTDKRLPGGKTVRCKACVKKLADERKAGRPLLRRKAPATTVAKALAAEKAAKPSKKRKRCPRCETVKPATLEYFAAASNNADGLQSWCKKCYSAWGKERTKKGLGKVKYRARKRRKDFELDRINALVQSAPDPVVVQDGNGAILNGMRATVVKMAALMRKHNMTSFKIDLSDGTGRYEIEWNRREMGTLPLE